MGELAVEITQRDGRIGLAGASLSLHDGRIRPPEVVSEIDNIQADIRVEGNRFVIQNTSGDIDGQNFRIHSTFDSATPDSGLEHLYFSAFDVDMGKIVLETSGRGIHAHIPLLMPKGSKAFIELGGKNGGGFVIAGPIERPLMRGTVTLSNLEFTFPFPPGKGGPLPRFVRGVLSVLNSARWDLDIIPERDNRYTHEIKALDSHTVLGDVSDS